MKKLLLIMILVFPVGVFSQNPTPTPQVNVTPTPIPMNTPVPQRTPQYNTTLEIQLQKEKLQAQELNRKLALRDINNLYRKITKEEKGFVTIDEDLIEKYKIFLKQNNTGLIRLLNKDVCTEHKWVVNASDECMSSQIPGAGASYSFRFKDYRLSHLADITVNNDLFFSKGNWQHTILVSLGDLNLETITLETNGIKYVSDFQPALDLIRAREIDYVLANTVEKNGFKYKNQALIKANDVYILRSIAYQGKVIKFLNGFPYNEFDYDKRKDIIVAFKVVKIGNDGSVTILWKQLSSKDSPKIDVEAQQKMQPKNNKYIANTKKSL